MFKWIKPEIIDAEDAKKVARGQAMVGAIICASVTLLVVVMTARGNTLFKAIPIGPQPMIDVYLLSTVAVGLFFMSRTASVIGFVYYLGSQAWMLYETKQYRFSIVPIILGIGFYNGIRATFAYHRLKKEAKSEASGAAAQPASPFKKIALIGGAFVLLAAGGVLAFRFYPKQATASVPESTPMQTVTQMIESVRKDVQKPATKTIRLKNGQMVNGAVIGEEDAKGFWVDSGDGAKFYLNRNEIEDIR